MHHPVTPSEDLNHFNQGIYLAAGSPWGVLELRGADAKAFLQGQTTTDTRQLSKEKSLLAATLSLKGRVLELFRILETDPDRLLLILPNATMVPFCNRMQRYLNFSKSQLSAVSEQWKLVVEGHPATTLPRHYCIHHSSKHLQVQLSQTRSLHLLQQPLDINTVFSSTVPILAEKYALLGDIRDGLCYLAPSLSDLYLPQMLHLQALDGLSFAKGCYTGQEVVARSWFRGHIKQALYAFHGPASLDCTPGTTVFINDTNGSAQASGTVLMAECSQLNYIEMLAVVRQENKDSVHHLKNNNGFFSPTSLPYAIFVREKSA